MTAEVASSSHRVSVVIPVYAGEDTLTRVVDELFERSEAWSSVSILEVVLVHDHGPDASADIIRSLMAADERVRAVWLTRNFGQHAATLAGMAATTQEWVVTLDEDGQHDPQFIPALIETAIEHSTPLVYGNSVNPPAHGRLRNRASRTAKASVAAMTGIKNLRVAQSYRLMTGEIARSAAAFAGPGSYLDVVLSWVAPNAASCATQSRTDGRPSSYRFRTLLSHFWRLVLASGTRPLRLIAVVGFLLSVASLIAAVYFTVERLTEASLPAGFAALMVTMLLTSGVVLISLGVVAEYIGAIVKVTLGRPAFLAGQDPATGPLGKPLPKS